MLASSALIQSLRSQFRKSPAGGPPALLMRISGLGQAARMASRPSFVVTSATTATVSVPVADRISPAARSRISRRLATTTSFTPSPPRAVAQLLPKPMLAAQTIAVRPRRPKSIFFLARLRRASRSSRRCPSFIDRLAKPCRPASIPTCKSWSVQSRTAAAGGSPRPRFRQHQRNIRTPCRRVL